MIDQLLLSRRHNSLFVEKETHSTHANLVGYVLHGFGTLSLSFRFESDVVVGNTAPLNYAKSETLHFVSLE